MIKVVVEAHTFKGGGGGEQAINKLPQVGEEFQYGEPHEKWIVTEVEEMSDYRGNEAVIHIRLEEE